MNTEQTAPVVCRCGNEKVYWTITHNGGICVVQCYECSRGVRHRETAEAVRMWNAAMSTELTGALAA